jgi:hypothetical protein
LAGRAKTPRNPASERRAIFSLQAGVASASSREKPMFDETKAKAMSHGTKFTKGHP